MSHFYKSIFTIAFLIIVPRSAGLFADTTIVLSNNTDTELYVSVATSIPPVAKIAAILPPGAFPVKIGVPGNIGFVFTFTPNAIKTYVRKLNELAEYNKAHPSIYSGLANSPRMIELSKFMSDFTKNPNTLVLATISGQIQESDGAYRRPLASYVITKTANGVLIFTKSNQ